MGCWCVSRRRESQSSCCCASWTAGRSARSRPSSSRVAAPSWPRRARRIDQHNQQVKTRGQWVRIVACPLPTKSPWLNPIEPKWIHGKRRVVQADGGLLSADELAGRVCAAFDCAHYEHLNVTENVA